MKTFHLDILTPYSHYLSKDVCYLKVQTDKFLIVILPDHAPLVSTLVVSEMIVKDENGEKNYAISGGIVRVDKGNKVTVLVDSIEEENDIDLSRAISSKERAERRLADAEKENAIDIKRARESLARAINRINIANKR